MKDGAIVPGALEANCPGQEPTILKSVTCGDGVRDPGEGCDDGNTILESCDYGLQACDVCNPSCQLEPGTVSFCGDGVIDAVAGEQCDGAGNVDLNCNAECQTPAVLEFGRTLNVGNGYQIRCTGYLNGVCLSAQVQTTGCGMAAGWQRLSWVTDDGARDQACEYFCQMANSMPVVSCTNATNIEDELNSLPPNGVTFDRWRSTV